MGHPWQINAPNLRSQILVQLSLYDFLQRSATVDSVEGGEESLARRRCGVPTATSLKSMLLVGVVRWNGGYSMLAED